ncbi:MAG TPA: hypothetical protein VLE02_01805 [Nitrosarchaeum sp.]|nr:hypothetical protein [Nitrosarchaeum sp.]
MYVNRHNDYPSYHNVGQLNVIGKQRRKGIIGNYGYPQQTSYTSLASQNFNDPLFYEAKINPNYPYPLDKDSNRQTCLNVDWICTEHSTYQPPCTFFNK